MKLTNDMFKIFERDDWTYRKDDLKTKEIFQSAYKRFAEWCTDLGMAYEKFTTPLIQQWQNSGNIYKYFWGRLKFIPYLKSGVCVSLFMNAQKFHIELSYEENNTESITSKEAYKELTLSHLNQWVDENDIDTTKFYISVNDDKNKCSLKDYFGSAEKRNWFTNTNIGIRLNIGISFNVSEITQLDSKELLTNVYKIGLLYEKSQASNQVYESLKNAGELVPSEYDGSYELVNEMVAAYKLVAYDKLDLNDLDAMFFMCIGTFKHGIEVKKRLIANSHLPDVEKIRITKLLEYIVARANRNEYINHLDRQGQVGMFGESVGSLRASYRDNDDITSAKDFIVMCTKINDFNVDDDIFNLIEPVLKRGVKGMQTGKISKFLHCLKPFVFPIINERRGAGTTVYDDLGIIMKNPEKAYNYIENTRKIKEYRNRYFKFKNYRVIDIVDSLVDPAVIIEKMETDMEKNIILYGPPGTGKTYNTAKYAVAIIENKSFDDVKDEKYPDIMNRYSKYKAEGRIEFTTFHQSYGYEEFVEGIKPVMDEGEDESGDIKYTIQPGIFKEFCTKASTVKKLTIHNKLSLEVENSRVWKVSLKAEADARLFKTCIDDGCIRLGWDDADVEGYLDLDNDELSKYSKNTITKFQDDMEVGDFVVAIGGDIKTVSVGVITGEFEYKKNLAFYKRYRSVRWLATVDRKEFLKLNENKALTLKAIYALDRVEVKDLMMLVEKYQEQGAIVEEENRNYAFIIDEINRGNISKILGELITLIEPSKRIGQSEALKVRLPYSKKEFGVPNNVYIIGTMNTADRSIALMDTALRRRFRFTEMQPDPSILAGVKVDGVDISDMLIKINRRITVLCDREHTIGHAYFTPLIETPTLENLANIFKNSIIPLFQEYFYEDYEKIRLVLGENNKEIHEQFVTQTTNANIDLFGIVDYDMDDEYTYEINSQAFYNIDSYKKI
jgi:5-methylcytosine-specific restriction protein B